MFKASEFLKNQLKTELNLDIIEAKVYREIRADTVLVISPHPDDDVFSCGGLLKHLCENGSKVKVLYISDGVFGNSEKKADINLIGIRENEAVSAARFLGVAEVNFLRLRDGSVNQNKMLWQKIYEELVIRNYDLIIVPSKDDWHRDHQATFLAFEMAYKRLKKAWPRVWQYQVWGANKVNTFFPIDRYLRYKKEASAMHRSQNRVVDYTKAVIDCNSYWGKIFGVSNYAEVFWEEPREQKNVKVTNQ